jgi:peptide/nickel transport system substrate-binding protein
MKHGDRLVLEKFEDYSLAKWGPTSIDRITIFMIPEIVTIAAKFEKGEIDLGIWSIPPKTIDDWRKKPNLVIKDDVAAMTWYLIMNNKKPPFDDLYVRKAIAYAFDYNTTMNSILGGGRRSTGPVPTGLFGHSDDIYQYNRDLNKAKEMLKKSKYNPSQSAQFNIEIAAVAVSERFKKIALLAANNLAEIGLRGQVKAVRWTDICQAQKTPETAYSIVVFYQGANVPHPLYFLTYFTQEGWGTAYPPGGMYYHNPKVTELIEKANATKDPEKQDDYYIEAQKLIVEDSPILFTHYDLRSIPFWRYLKGYISPVGAHPFKFWFHRFWMDVNDELYKKNHS